MPSRGPGDPQHAPDAARARTPGPPHAPGPEPETAPPGPSILRRGALSPPRPLSPREVLHLQRTVGNRATGRLLAAARPSAVQRKPSTFAAQAQDALALQAGDKVSKVRESSTFSLFGSVFNNAFATPWTRFREALEAYTALPDDPVTAQHQEKLDRVRTTLDRWKREHRVNDPDKELNENEQSKLAAVNRVEAVLPDEVQYARAPAAERPAAPGRIVVSRLEFMFQEALGDSFLAVHSEAAWRRWVAALPPFPPELLEEEIPGGEVERLRNLADADLVALAVSRTETLRGGSDANTKISYAGYAILPRLVQMAGREQRPRFDDFFAPHARAALEDLVDNQLRGSYPALADDLETALENDQIQGVELNTFLTAISESYVGGQPARVAALDEEDLAQLRDDIRASPEYDELVQVAGAAGEADVAANLPGEADALEERRNGLLGTLAFELQEEREDGTLVPVVGGEVPETSKRRVVDAVMIFEALAGRRFPRLPRFILVRKPGGTYRANADSESQFIRYDVNFEMRTGVHELGHFYENQVPLDQWYAVYTLMRSRHTDAAARLEKDGGRTFAFSFHQQEHGLLGGLGGLRHPALSEYSARYYQTGHTEMMSLFSEHLIRDDERERMIEADPQGFAVMLRVLRPGALPGWSQEELGFG